jgi:hypothetical protein
MSQRFKDSATVRFFEPYKPDKRYEREKRFLTQGLDDATTLRRNDAKTRNT